MGGIVGSLVVGTIVGSSVRTGAFVGAIVRLAVVGWAVGRLVTASAASIVTLFGFDSAYGTLGAEQSYSRL